jgi:hypothetical protein
MVDDLWECRRYAIHEENVEDSPVLLIKGIPRRTRWI